MKKNKRKIRNTVILDEHELTDKEIQLLFDDSTQIVFSEWFKRRVRETEEEIDFNKDRAWVVRLQENYNNFYRNFHYQEVESENLYPKGECL